MDTFSGLLTICDAPSAPEGSSPRNQNVDFNVGSVFTRNDLTNPFIYNGAAAGPSPGTEATDISLPGGSPWSGVANVLTNIGTYATTTLNVNSLIGASLPSITQTGPNLNAWSNLANIVNTGAGVTPDNANTAVITVQSSAIPADAQITGIQVSFSAFTSYSGTFAPAVANFTFGGDTKVLTASGPSSPQPYIFGGATDLWGITPTVANLVSGITLSIAPVNGTANALFISSLSVEIAYNNSDTDGINVQQFGFSVPSSATPQGFAVSVLGFTTLPATLNVQMLKAGVPVGDVRSFPISVSGTPVPIFLGGINDLFGASWVYSDLNSTTFGLRLSASGYPGSVINLGYTQLTAYFLPQQENFNYICTFEDDFGTIRNVSLDASGEFFLENISTNPGTLIPLLGGPPANSFADSFTSDSRQYFAISDLLQGNYPPQQYTGQWNDRVSQVGPGQAPQFSALSSLTDTFSINNITQPPGHSDGSSYFLQSQGPGSQAAGNVVTVYYADSTVIGPDTDLVNAFNSGFPVYVYFSFTGGPSTQGPYTVLVTSVNQGQPPGQPRQFYYFTFNLPTSNFIYYQGSGHPGYTANYQRTLATMTMNVPVPGLEVGNQVTISGTSVTAYNALWTISQTPNSGAFSITLTSVASGVATFDYTLISGTAPAAGQIVTITGTDNANGQLNLVNASIASATGGSSGSFTINVSLPNFVASPEQGQGATAGTIFDFDPGALFVGTSTNPIYGTSTGGDIIFQGNGQFITAGTRQGTVFFITRNGYWTRPAPPVTFTCSENTTNIQASNIPIGPPNVIARAVVFTEAGANGVPGASFYTIPQPVNYIVDNVQYTATSLFINDNVTQSASFSFLDATLLSATEVDIQGADLFNLGELGNSAWCTSYAGRSVWGRVQTKIQNFLNLTFDGGYLNNPGSLKIPLGWNLVNSTVPTNAPPTLLNSPVFGNSYYMNNTSGSTQALFSMLYQSAYEDWNNVAILQNQTAYSVRVTARIPSGITGGALVVDLAPFNATTGFGDAIGSFVLTSMTTVMATYTGTLLTSNTLNIPSNLVIRLYGQNVPNGADIEVDRIEIFPTEQPTNLTQLVFSYVDDNESFDLVTGGNDTTTVNNQPANGAFTMHDTLYVVKESSLGFLQDSPNQEPANWNPFKEVSNVAGASGIHAYDVGEEWAIMACQNGLFLFNGGAPVPINLEIPDIWQAINWNYGHTIVVRNDVANRKIYCAIPLATPNPWMTTTVVNANPTKPNVVLALNYDGLDTVEKLMEASAMHVTMMGKLAVHDLRRKWSLWTIATPYMGMIKRNELFSEMLFCNGIASSKIYQYGPGSTGSDDGVPQLSSYCTYGFVDKNKESEQPMFGLHNKRFCYFDILASGTGTPSLTFWQNILAAPYPYSVPGGLPLTTPEANDIEGPLNEFAQRLFVEIAVTGNIFNISRLTLVGAADRWSQIRGF